ncbi:MAG: shikimate dehydrogenase [Rickettsiales bacterium]
MISIKKAGVVGFPVGHSLSPRLHGFWLKKYNIAGEYKHYEVRPEDLAEFIHNLRSDNDFSGVNLTIPHKESVIKLLDNIDEIATEIGAVNVVINKNGKLIGKNTDAYGFAENIRTSVTGTKKAVVLGAGGAAKAVIFALLEIGFKEIIITNRSRVRAEELSSVIRHPLSVVDWQKRGEILENTDLLVNTTSLGMTGKEPLEIDLWLLPKTALVTDIVYSPLITPLLAQAKARGNPTVDGLGMLLYQAVPAFEAWFGIKPEVTEELRQYVLAGIKS